MFFFLGFMFFLAGCAGDQSGDEVTYQSFSVEGRQYKRFETPTGDVCYASYSGKTLSCFPGK
jgi:hypothetical protein